MNLSENHLRVLGALRAATVLTREPGTLTPDGHEKWHSLSELNVQGYLHAVSGDDLAALSSAARGLYKQHLVALHTARAVTRYAILPEGYLALAEHDACGGRSAYVAAELELHQAYYDLERARERVDTASARLADEAGKLRSRERTS